jgi:hypothetical protein
MSYLDNAILRSYRTPARIAQLEELVNVVFNAAFSLSIKCNYMHVILQHESVFVNIMFGIEEIKCL